jgi:hypothetical protein
MNNTQLGLPKVTPALVTVSNSSKQAIYNWNSNGLISAATSFHTTQQGQSTHNPIEALNILKMYGSLFNSIDVTTTINTPAKVVLDIDVSNLDKFIRNIHGGRISTKEDVESQCIELEVSAEFMAGALAAAEILLNNAHLSEVLNGGH